MMLVTVFACQPCSKGVRDEKDGYANSKRGRHIQVSIQERVEESEVSVMAVILAGNGATTMAIFSLGLGQGVVDGHGDRQSPSHKGQDLVGDDCRLAVLVSLGEGVD